MLNKNPVVKLGEREFRLVPRDHASACAGCVAEGGDQDGLCGALPTDCVETGVSTSRSRIQSGIAP